MKSFKIYFALLCGVFLIVGCEKEVKIGCDATSLRQECVDKDAKALPAPEYSKVMAFESKNLERSYQGAPPQIPHSLEDVVINQEMNMCLDCHFPGGDPIPALPKSHLTVPVVKVDKAQRPNVTVVVGHVPAPADTYDQARYFCTQCHVPQAMNLKPLVVNTFK